MMDIVVDVGITTDGATTLTARDLSTPGWRLDPLRPASATVVVGGQAIPVNAITSVTVRVAAVPRNILAWIDPADREYAAAEMTAVLTAWLALFPGPVDHRPYLPTTLTAMDEPTGGRVLLVGSSVDTPTLEVRSCLYRHGCSPLILDEKAFAESDSASLLRSGHIGTVPLADIGAIYLRPDTCLGQGQQALIAWTQHAPGVVVNRPAAMALNASKSLQLAEISRYGLDVPATLVTTCAEAVRDFVAQHRRVVFKSASGVRSIATEYALADDDRLHDVGACPTLFQAFVPGIDVRVHVVGSESFACEIEADRLDYRYASTLTMRPVELPSDLRERLVAMVRAMGLHVAGVDLRRRFDDGWTCLEVNPSPAFTWYSEYTRQPVADAIAQLLLGTCALPT